MILYINEILIDHLWQRNIIFPTTLGGDMLVPRRVYIYIYIHIYIYLKREREREREREGERERVDSFRFCLEWLYQRSFTWNTHVNLQSARWKKWWPRHLVSQCWEPIILLVVSTSQFATALQHLGLSENKVVEMTGNHQVKKSSGIPTHQTIKNRSAMNSAMVFPSPKKNTQQPFPLHHFCSHLCFWCTFLFSTRPPATPGKLFFLGFLRRRLIHWVSCQPWKSRMLPLQRRAVPKLWTCLGWGGFWRLVQNGVPDFLPGDPRPLRKPINETHIHWFLLWFVVKMAGFKGSFQVIHHGFEGLNMKPQRFERLMDSSKRTTVGFNERVGAL